MDDNNREAFWRGFEQALYFTDTGGDDQPQTELLLDPETELNLRADCRSFLARAGEMIAYNNRKHGTTFAQAGQYFWMTRNGHGAGFWDGAWSNYGDRLTELSGCYGEVSIFEHDGRIASC